MKKIFFAALVAVSLTTSCTNEETIGTEKANREIEFRAVTEKGQTRGVEVSSINFFSFRVWAEWDGRSMWLDESFTFMPGLVVTKDKFEDGTWTYSPQKHWPTSGTVEFIAYSPITSYFFKVERENLPESEEYDLPEDHTLREDLLAAYYKTDNLTASQPGSVPLTFKHLLTEFNFQVRNAMEGLTLRIFEIKLINVHKFATYDFRAGEWTDFNGGSEQGLYAPINTVDIAYDESFRALSAPWLGNNMFVITGAWNEPESEDVIYDDNNSLESEKSYICVDYAVIDGDKLRRYRVFIPIKQSRNTWNKRYTYMLTFDSSVAGGYGAEIGFDVGIEDFSETEIEFEEKNEEE
jgi:hypothetical protein